MKAISSGSIFSVTLLFCSCAMGQTPPAIRGPNGATSAAFWYLGDVSPNCCSGLTNKYWTIWAVTLTTNTPDPNPTIAWSTDSPTKVRITPNGQTGATLSAVGHSAPGTTYDIHVSVTVDGIQSAPFPVFINTPWTQSHTGPSPTATCASIWGLSYPNGWVGQVTNTIRDLPGYVVTPLDVRETFENDIVKYTGEDWGIPAEANWPADPAKHSWSGNTFVDTYLMCWNPQGVAIPPTVSWNPNGGTLINTDTQKYWTGSLTGFHGECSQRHSISWYTNHIALGSVTTPISDQSTCLPGKGFLNN